MTDIVAQVHRATHPTKVRIARELVQGVPLKASQLAERIEILEDTVRFHLLELETEGFITSRQCPSSGQRVDVVFSLNPRYREVLEEAPNLI